METIFPRSANVDMSDHSQPNHVLADGKMAGAIAMTGVDHFESWLHGKWMYPKTTLGGLDAAFATFEIPLVVVLVIVAMIQLTCPKRTAYSFDLVQTYITKMLNKPWDKTGLGRCVSLVTHEQFNLFLAALTLISIVSFKIICGSTSANAGTIILIALFAVGYSAVRTAKQPKISAVNLILAISAFASLHIAYIAYTDAAGNATETGKHVGRQPLFMVAGIFFALTTLTNMYVCIARYNGTTGKLKRDEDIVQTISDGEYLFWVSELELIVVTFCVTIFVVLESIFVANAATAYYNTPFYFLYTIPIFYLALQFVGLIQDGKDGSDVDKLPRIFNMFYIVIGFVVLCLVQFHVASIPYRDEDGSWKRQIGAPKYPHKSQVGLRIHFAEVLHTAPAGGDHTHALADAVGAIAIEKIVMQKAGLIMLELFTVLFLAMAYIASEFSRREGVKKFKSCEIVYEKLQRTIAKTS
jgi:hypothetical protein